MTESSGGEQHPLQQTAIYGELRALACHFLRGERKGHTLQPTALVHEAFLRLGHLTDKAPTDKHGLVRLAAKTMRLVLVDHARRRNAQKRWGKATREPLDDAVAVYHERAFDLIALHEALERLAEIDPRSAQVVDLRFFAGLSEAETAATMGVSTSTVRREWSLARQWLYHALKEEERLDPKTVDEGEEDRGARPGA